MGRTVVGSLLSLVGVALIGYGFIETADVGNCGGQFQSECPDETWRDVGAIFVGFIAMFSGLGVLVTRGRKATSWGLPPTGNPIRSNPMPLGQVVPRVDRTPAPPTSPSPPTSATEVVAKLERLGKLREQGVLTEEEFEKQKAAVLRGAA